MHIFQNFTSDLKLIWQDLLIQLQEASNNPKNPLRTLSLATQGPQGTDVRMIILRHFNPSQLCCTFYTDFRAKKNQDIQKQPQVTLLAYNTDSKRQIRLYGHAEMYDEPTRAQQWKKLTDHSKTLYATESKPGSIHASRKQANQLSDLKNAQQNFMSYKIHIHKIEDLQLTSSPIKRTAFQITRDSDAQQVDCILAQYLTP